MTGRPRGVVAETLRTVTGMPLWIIPLGMTTPPLTLNGRYHYRVRARHVKAIRTAVWTRGRQLAVHPVPHVHVTLFYVPRDRRDRDPDNLVATLKPAIDALTAAGQDRGRICLGIVPDDTPGYVSWSPPRILEPDQHGPRLWLEVQALTSAPSYGVPAPATPSEGA